MSSFSQKMEKIYRFSLNTTALAVILMGVVLSAQFYRAYSFSKKESLAHQHYSQGKQIEDKQPAHHSPANTSLKAKALKFFRH